MFAVSLASGASSQSQAETRLFHSLGDPKTPGKESAKTSTTPLENSGFEGGIRWMKKESWIEEKKTADEITFVFYTQALS